MKLTTFGGGHDSPSPDRAPDEPFVYADDHARDVGPKNTVVVLGQRLGVAIDGQHLARDLLAGL